MTAHRGTVDGAVDGAVDPTPDVKLAYEVLDARDAYRRHFQMDWWLDAEHSLLGLAELTTPDCGTSACFAGWAVVLRGYQIGEPGRVYRDGKLVSADIEWFARDLLGITHDQALDLFFVANEDIDDAVERVFGPRPDGA